MHDENRTRSIERVNRIFKYASTLEAAIAGCLQARDDVHVLEVGFGYGRVLVELA